MQTVCLAQFKGGLAKKNCQRVTAFSCDVPQFAYILKINEWTFLSMKQAESKTEHRL